MDKISQTLTYRKRQSTSLIILHATHTHNTEAPNLEAWLKVTGRKMGLLSIGYHYIVFSDGRHLCTRPHDTIGSHCPGFNKDSIGLVLQGGLRIRPGEDGEEQRVQCDDFTDAQMDALRFLCGYLTKHYGPLDLKGHTELGHHRHRLTRCPPLDMHKVRTICHS